MIMTPSIKTNYMRTAGFIILIFLTGKLYGQMPLPNLTCATAVQGCNNDTLHYQCCADPTCSPTTASHDAWYEFCLVDNMITGEALNFWSRFGFQGYTLYG